MSEPKKRYEDKIQGALNELVSAMSALNMHPDPIPNSEGYLSETDGWAKHAMEHMHAVFELLNEAHKEREKLKYKIYRLEVSLKEK